MNLHPLICPCGSLRFDCTLVMFPLQWTAKCRCCGQPGATAMLKLGEPKREWVNGMFDEDSRWIPGHWKT